MTGECDSVLFGTGDLRCTSRLGDTGLAGVDGPLLGGVLDLAGVLGLGGVLGLVAGLLALKVRLWRRPLPDAGWRHPLLDDD